MPEPLSLTEIRQTSIWDYYIEKESHPRRTVSAISHSYPNFKGGLSKLPFNFSAWMIHYTTYIYLYIYIYHKTGHGYLSLFKFQLIYPFHYPWLVGLVTSTVSHCLSLGFCFVWVFVCFCYWWRRCCCCCFLSTYCWSNLHGACAIVLSGVKRRSRYKCMEKCAEAFVTQSFKMKTIAKSNGNVMYHNMTFKIMHEWITWIKAESPCRVCPLYFVIVICHPKPCCVESYPLALSFQMVPATTGFPHKGPDLI